MIQLLGKLAPREGYTQSLLDGVMFMRANQPMSCAQALYEPGIVIVVQGRKRGFHGGEMYVYDPQQYLVLSVPLPLTIETEATEEEPLLGLVLRIDPATTAELAQSVEDDSPEQPATLYATAMETKLEEATLRLLEALCSPTEAKLLGPSIFREITYRVLTGSQGGRLRAALEQGGNFGRIAKVLHRIHHHYAGQLDVTSLAKEANLSVPAFHAHFKNVTHTSPIQYIKAIRLHQARLIMIRKGINATTASEQVGYESASQFSREFKRLFGRSPVDETRHLRQILSLAAPVVANVRRSL